MQIVIDISKEKYEYIKKRFDSDVSATGWIEIVNGTPLPKGHGRLVDVNDLYEQYAYTCYNFNMTMEYVPTIIEADRSEEE